MQPFYYSFVLTLFHSLWQALLLLMGYNAILFFNKNTAPLFKRNLLFSLLGLQLIISIGSFFIIYFSAEFISLNFLLPEIENLNTNGQWPMWLFAGYLILLGFKTGNLFRSYHKLLLLKKESFLKVSPELKIFTQQKAFLLGIKRPVTIAYHKYISTPLTYGFLKPVILLPFSLCNSISIADAETLVLHELTHIKNKDYLLNLFLPWIENIFFFNPFIQIIIKDIRLEREKSCDWQVLQFNYEPIAYAEILLQTARLPQTSQNIFLAAVSKPSQLLKRIQYFSNFKNNAPHKSTYKWMVMPFLFLIGFFCLSILANRIETVKEEKKSLATTDQVFEKMVTVNPVLQNIEALPLKENKITAPVINTSAPATPKKSLAAIPVAELSNLVSNNTLVVDSLSFAVQHYDIIPVSYLEADSLLTREVTVTEEFSGGEKVTKTYLVRLVKGEWQAAPLWMIKEMPPIKDSSNNIKDSLAPLHINLLKDSVQ